MGAINFRASRDVGEGDEIVNHAHNDRWVAAAEPSLTRNKPKTFDEAQTKENWTWQRSKTSKTH